MQLLSHLQWWSNTSTHLLQALQCFVRTDVMLMLHRWHRPFSITCAWRLRSNSGMICLSCRVLSKGWAGSRVRAVTWATMWARNSVAEAAATGATSVECKAGTTAPYMRATMTRVRSHPSTCWGCSGYCKPCTRLSRRAPPFCHSQDWSPITTGQGRRPHHLTGWGPTHHRTLYLQQRTCLTSHIANNMHKSGTLTRFCIGYEPNKT